MMRRKSAREPVYPSLHHGRRAILSLLALLFFAALSACGGGGGGGDGGGGGNPTGACGTAPGTGTEVYVNSATGSDTNDGTPSAPKSSISCGIAAAVTAGFAEVRVAGGTYDVSEPLVFSEGVSMFGGYASDFGSRDPIAFTTTIQDTRTIGVVWPDYNAVIEVDASISSATIFDGFSVLGGELNNQGRTAAIRTIGGSPTIRNNRIDGHNIPRWAIFGDAAASYGIVIEGGATPLIEANTILAGQGDVAYGVFSTASTPTIRNNTIDGGSTPLFNTYGIFLETSDAQVLNNTINGGDAGPAPNAAYGFYIRSSNPRIDNNIVFTIPGTSWNFCIYEFDGIPTPTSVANNDLTSCGDALYANRTFTGGPQGCSTARTCYTTIVDMEANVANSSNNVSADPLFADQAGGDWHFTGLPPASVTSGGLNGIDMGWGFTDDKDGVPRPASGTPWAMGAYEP